MRAAQFHRQAEPVTDDSSAGMLAMVESVLARWIRDQAAYFARAVHRERQTASRIKWGANVCLIVSAIIALLLAVVAAEHMDNQRGILVMLLTSALAGAGLLRDTRKS